MEEACSHLELFVLILPLSLSSSPGPVTWLCLTLRSLRELRKYGVTCCRLVSGLAALRTSTSVWAHIPCPASEAWLHSRSTAAMADPGMMSLFGDDGNLFSDELEGLGDCGYPKVRQIQWVSRCPMSTKATGSSPLLFTSPHLLYLDRPSLATILTTSTSMSSPRCIQWTSKGAGWWGTDQ